jgi:chorismate-pyruvate lyase
MTSPPRRATPELNALVDLFYPEPLALGAFVEVPEAELPAVARQLLAHDEHMTVTIEAFHGCPVSVQVLQTHVTATHYARRILLRRQSEVVQFGIVRLALALLDADVRREIESQQAPLGRVLIEHNVLRNVRLLSLWRIEPGEDLQRLFRIPATGICYGRTALIYCDGVPAVELLEVPTPSEPV